MHVVEGNAMNRIVLIVHLQSVQLRSRVVTTAPIPIINQTWHVVEAVVRLTTIAQATSDAFNEKENNTYRVVTVQVYPA